MISEVTLLYNFDTLFVNDAFMLSIVFCFECYATRMSHVNYIITLSYLKMRRCYISQLFSTQVFTFNQVGKQLACH